jgi:hypothetical protein
MSDSPPYFLPAGAKLTDLLAAPRGTMHPHATKPGYWWCRGSAEPGKEDAIYEVFPGDPATGEGSKCGCKGHRFYGTCSHVDWAREAQRRRDACPVCGGAAVWRPSGAVVYVDGYGRAMDPIACVGCLGDGTRAEWERLGSFPEEETPRAPGADDHRRGGLPPEWGALSDAELRKVFA